MLLLAGRGLSLNGTNVTFFNWFGQDIPKDVGVNARKFVDVLPIIFLQSHEALAGKSCYLTIF
jgi:hypothetical protein